MTRICQNLCTKRHCVGVATCFGGQVANNWGAQCILYYGQCRFGGRTQWGCTYYKAHWTLEEELEMSSLEQDGKAFPGELDLEQYSPRPEWEDLDDYEIAGILEKENGITQQFAQDFDTQQCDN